MVSGTEQAKDPLYYKNYFIKPQKSQNTKTPEGKNTDREEEREEEEEGHPQLNIQ